LVILLLGVGQILLKLGFKLAQAGHDITFIDRGERLQAMQTKGLTLISPEGQGKSLDIVQATDDTHSAGPQDFVILGVKAHQIASVAESLPALYGAHTIVVTLQNGIPWWYFQKQKGEYAGKRLLSLDPSGVIEANIEPERIVGCVAYPGAEVMEPGTIKHVEGDRFPIGELDGLESERCQKFYQMLIDAGLRSRILNDIRGEIWLKAWGTLSFNPISALTHATLEDICRFPETRQLAAVMMGEAQQVAEKLGIQFRHTIERRINGAEGVGPHKTSMLQDVESGKSLEIEALVGAVIELAGLTQTPVPAIESVYACVKLLNRTFLDARSRVGLVPNR